MDAMQHLNPEREWNAQRWRCAGVAVALVVWLTDVLVHPTVPSMVRWAFAPFFLVLIPIFIRNTVHKWHAYRGLTR